MGNKKDLNILLEAVNILKNECLLKKDTEMKILKYENKTIKPRPNGKGFFTRYRDANGQHSIYGKTAEEVLQKLKSVLKNAPKKKYGKTLAWWWFEWLRIWKQDIRPGTKRTYDTIFRIYLKSIGELKLNELNVFNISEFLNNISSSRQRVRTFNYLNACLDKAEKIKLIEQNPLQLLPKPKHEKEHVNAMTLSDQDKFITALTNSQSKYSDLFLVMLQEGLRIGEALGLTGDNIDFANRTITVNKTYSHGAIGVPKTKSSKRTIPMFGTVYNILLKHAGTKPGERIFNFSEHPTNLAFHKFLHEAQIENIYKPHSLRATFATRLYEAGVPSLQIRDWLGHSDVATTEQIYIKVLKESSLKWVNLASFLVKSDTQPDTQIISKIRNI